MFHRIVRLWEAVMFYQKKIGVEAVMFHQKHGCTRLCVMGLWCAPLSHHNFVPVAKPAGEAIWAPISPAAASAAPLLKR